MLISDVIFEMLKEKGITQKELSIRTNIPQSTISDWKRKHLNPSSDKLFIICSVLGITPTELLAKAGADRSDSGFISLGINTDEHKLIEVFRKLDDKSKKQLLQYMKNLAEK